MQFRNTDVLRPEAPDWSGPVFRPLYVGMSHRRIEHRATDRFEFSAIEPAWGLRLVLRGKARVTMDGRRYTLAPGQAVVIPAPSRGEWTQLPGPGLSTLLFAAFIGPLAGAFCEMQIKQQGMFFRFEPEGPTARAADRLLHLAQRQIHREARKWSHAAFEVLDAWRHEAHQHARSQPHLHDRPEPSRLVSRNISNVTEFAEQLGYSRSYLSGRLSKVWNGKPGAILRDARLRAAAELLGDRQLSIAAVARQSGYAETASFSRAFKKQFGCTPSAYRRDRNRG
ncbi:MAG: AraC family transcriptional regulator [Planctomycetota bacterium]